MNSVQSSFVGEGLYPGVLVGGHEALEGLLDGLELLLGGLDVVRVLVRVPHLGQVPVRLARVRLRGT